MTGDTVDPWAAHVRKFGIADAQITGTQPDGELLVRHGLALIVQEGRYETLVDDEAGRPAPSLLAYGCFVTLAGADEAGSWSGTDMQIVITGTHENGWRITIAGLGALGYDDKGSLEVQFDVPPSMAVHELAR